MSRTPTTRVTRRARTRLETTTGRKRKASRQQRIAVLKKLEASRTVEYWLPTMPAHVVASAVRTRMEEYESNLRA